VNNDAVDVAELLAPAPPGLPVAGTVAIREREGL
jgi:hypothetical protein